LKESLYQAALQLINLQSKPADKFGSNFTQSSLSTNQMSDLVNRPKLDIMQLNISIQNQLPLQVKPSHLGLRNGNQQISRELLPPIVGKHRRFATLPFHTAVHNDT
jgi:hypothetical protein